MLDFPRWKVVSIWLTIAVLCALAIPSLLPQRITDQWGSFPHPRINLGLDLAGGSYLLLEADVNDVASNRLEAMREQVQTEMRRQKPRIEIGDISTRGGRLSFLLRDPSQVDAARERLLSITGGGVGMTGQREWDIQVVDSSRLVLTPTKAGLDQAIDTAMGDASARPPSSSSSWSTRPRRRSSSPPSRHRRAARCCLTRTTPRASR
jgi:preprotein translocase subunit SecD